MALKEKKKFVKKLYSNIGQDEHSKITDWTKKLIFKICNDLNCEFPEVSNSSISDEYKIISPRGEDDIYLSWGVEAASGYLSYFYTTLSVIEYKDFICVDPASQNTKICLSNRYFPGSFCTFSIFLIGDNISKHYIEAEKNGAGAVYVYGSDDFSGFYEKLYKEIKTSREVINQLCNYGYHIPGV